MSCTRCLFNQCIPLDLFQIGIKMSSVVSLADSCIPLANLFCEYFPPIDLLLKCQVIEPFEIYRQNCESGLKHEGKECLWHIDSHPLRAVLR